MSSPTHASNKSPNTYSAWALPSSCFNKFKKPCVTRGKSAAKSKFDVYPSAYANGYAVQVCKGTKPGLDGKKRCSSPYC